VTAIDDALADDPALRIGREAGAAVAATGGTATALAAVDLGLAVYDPRRVHGHQLAAATVFGLVVRLLAQPLAARSRLAALDPERASILPAGALVLEAVMRAAGAPAVQISEHAVRHEYLRERLAAEGVATDLREMWG